MSNERRDEGHKMHKAKLSRILGEADRHADKDVRMHEKTKPHLKPAQIAAIADHEIEMKGTPKKKRLDRPGRKKGGRLGRDTGGASNAPVYSKDQLMGTGMQNLINNAQGDNDLSDIVTSARSHGISVPKSLSDVKGYKKGGRTGKGDVNIIIGQKPDQPMMPPQGAMPPMMPPPRPPMMPPQGAAPMPPPGGMPPGAIPPGMAPGAAAGIPPQMPRKKGGRADHPDVDMKYGAGGGLARLEKIAKYGARK